MKYPKLTKACDHRGASMGRNDYIDDDRTQAIKLHLYKMPMRDGCYDSGGAYWGMGNHRIGYMYHAYGVGVEEHNDVFVRAVNREKAKELVRLIFPNAKFFR